MTISTTQLQIVNQALAQAQARSQLTSMQDKSAEGRYVRLFYDDTRRGLLRSAQWNFGTKAATLTLQKAAPGTPENTSSASEWTSAYPMPPWLYQYAYPDDCLQFRCVVPMWPVGSQTIPGATPAAYPWGLAIPQNMMVPFKIAEGTLASPDEATIVTCINTNQQDAIGIYTVDVTDVARWDANFKEAMVAALASQLAIPISGSKTLWKAKAQAAYAIVQQARSRDGVEGTTVDDHMPEWLAARGYGLPSQPGTYASGWFTPGFLIVA